ncbi:MAG: DUF547 domain-containing protein [Bacteroidia bacterium]|nr:DUF547 domain-containing protein [Bacteroidia bacterium]NND25381.1 DUF547 domain-containing protein [Flavobacteriaceae bacterium]MBT8279571.1 DUF547 domain-containing protein [Bacteroidia bacterium]NNK60282.1 DUF547 domain-containing protein [Flavobacteriaceae bacterium]NNL34090.1 DUF547 domain-containing protein [Flavobacteriaceae bacterium]
MKYLNLILTLILVSSCCASNEIAQNSTSVSETPEANTVQLVEVVSGTLNEDELEVTPTLEPIPENGTLQMTSVSEAFDHSAWNNLLKSYVDDKGLVNYKAFKNDPSDLRNYITALGTNMPNDRWTKADKLAYWINAYNALTVDLIIRNYPLNSIKDIKNPWDQRLWKLGDKWYNLDEIEHQILRKMDEPRIHFGIVCASYSCPRLLNEAYTASNLDAQLNKVTQEFLADTNRNIIEENEVNLSKIFQWFSKDFKSEGSVIDFINQYTSIRVSAKAKIKYMDYNWDLNE